jgi:hypothetical protein
MRRIRFHYSAGYAGTNGYEDVLVDDDETEDDLEQQAQDIANTHLPEQEIWYEEIKNDDDSWEGD